MAPKSSPAAKEVTAVKYIGIAYQRRVLAQEWAEAGIENQGDVFWDANNGFTVMADKLNKEALAALRDDEFMVFLTGEEEAND